jgi:hypothetical protein
MTVIITVLKSVAKKRLLKTEDFMSAVITVVIGVCGSVGLLWLVVVEISKWSIDHIFNPKPRRETLKHVAVFKTPLGVGHI